MHRKELGIIRVLTLGHEQNKGFEDTVDGLFPYIKAKAVSIPDQPEGVHDDYTHNLAVPKVVEAAKQFELMGVSAVFVNCAADPGVEEARKEVRIPVFGAGSTAAIVAKAMGLPVGVIGISDEPPEVIKRVLEDRIIGHGKPGGTNTALDLTHPSTVEEIKGLGMALKQKGAGCILLACTGMSPLGFAPILREYLEMPVIEPLYSALTVVSYIVSGKPHVGVK
jgi:allantoin racemase